MARILEENGISLTAWPLRTSFATGVGWGPRGKGTRCHIFMGIFNKCEEMCVSKWDKKVALLELFHFRTVSKAAQEKLRKGVAGIQNHTSPLPKEAGSRAWPAAGARAAPGCLCSKHCFQNRVKTKLLYPGLACHITDFFDAFEQMHIFLLLQLEGSPWGLSPARAPRRPASPCPRPAPPWMQVCAWLRSGEQCFGSRWCGSKWVTSKQSTLCFPETAEQGVRASLTSSFLPASSLTAREAQSGGLQLAALEANAPWGVCGLPHFWLWGLVFFRFLS